MLFFPLSLQKYKRWSVWKLEPDEKGKSLKIPYNVYGFRASIHKPSDWTNYETALSILNHLPRIYNGLGYNLPENKITYIDIDSCISTDGQLDVRAKKILSILPETYTEYSVSGTGLHILTFGNVSKGFNNRTERVEMYSCGRFCALTGNVLKPLEPCSDQEALKRLYEMYKPPEKQYSQHRESFPISLNSLSDEDALKYAERDIRFSSVFSGDTTSFNSDSEADLYLCGRLAFWTDRDPEAIDRLFRRSALCDAKWTKRSDYRKRTISLAISNCQECFSEYRKRTFVESYGRHGH